MDQKIDVVVIDTQPIVITTKSQCSEAKIWWESIQTRLLSNCHIGYFRISLSLSTQALLWKTLVHSTQHDANPHRLPSTLPSIALILLWSLAVFTLSATSIVYIFKCFFDFNKVKKEFLHHININYFFAPSISSLLLLHASPFPLPTSHVPIITCLFIFPIVVLDIKIYGQWLTKGKRLLSRVANPVSQLSVIANLVAARASAEMMGWEEFPLFLFALGMAHYLVLFVTLYQRLPGGDGLPANLRPAFFLFGATPSMASLAWTSINGSFDTAAKMFFFLSLFLFVSLICRPRLFKKSMKKFGVAWWAYAFCLTLFALAAHCYAEEVQSPATHALMLLLSILSILVLFVLLVFTFMNANNLLFGAHVAQHRNGITSPFSC